MHWFNCFFGILVLLVSVSEHFTSIHPLKTVHTSVRQITNCSRVKSLFNILTNSPPSSGIFFFNFVWLGFLISGQTSLFPFNTQIFRCYLPFLFLVNSFRRVTISANKPKFRPHIFRFENLSRRRQESFWLIVGFCPSKHLSLSVVLAATLKRARAYTILILKIKNIGRIIIYPGKKLRNILNRIQTRGERKRDSFSYHKWKPPKMTWEA